METKKYTIIYIVTSIILNFLLMSVAVVPIFICINCIFSDLLLGKFEITMGERIESFVIIIFILIVIFAINFVVYKLISKKAKLKIRWGIIAFITILITYILIVNALV